MGSPGMPPMPSRAGVVYKKYLLSEHKTFDSLYFPEKHDVLKLLDQFLNKTGKFAIKGFPNKLGLLLHGPPGTGKTSLIKSIAQYTGRHIVDVPISKVKTNQELFDIMFDLVFAVPGEDEALRMKFDNIVFVMEDVDAASKVVYARGKDADRKKGGTAGSQDGTSVHPEAAPRDSKPKNVRSAPSLALERQRTMQLIRTISVGSSQDKSAAADLEKTAESGKTSEPSEKVEEKKADKTAAEKPAKSDEDDDNKSDSEEEKEKKTKIRWRGTRGCPWPARESWEVEGWH